jgi:hypothetical protein
MLGATEALVPVVRVQRKVGIDLRERIEERLEQRERNKRYYEEA